MNNNKIKILLQKYYNAETTWEEEKYLSEYFNNNEVPYHLKLEKEQFCYYKNKTEERSTQFEKKILKAIEKEDARSVYRKKKKFLYQVISIAASIILIVSVYFIKKRSYESEDTYKNPQLAYNETKKTLLLISKKLNEGTEDIKNISEFDKSVENLNKISTINTSVKKLSNISVFSNGMSEINKLSKFSEAERIVKGEKK